MNRDTCDMSQLVVSGAHGVHCIVHVAAQPLRPAKGAKCRNPLIDAQTNNMRTRAGGRR
jgi:hypothetical protein